MKKSLSYLILFLISLLLLFTSCKKASVDSASKEKLIVGKWSINKVRINIVTNGSVVKDSTLPNTPQPENYVTFNSDGTVQYKFNSTTTLTGNYYFSGEDSVYATIGSTMYRWKNLLLTTQIFNVQTSQQYPQMPGTTIETYQTFVR